MIIMIPTNCPVCDSLLTKIKDQLFCVNKSCDAQNFKQILHFAKTMKIKGLGEQTLIKLNVDSINTIYSMTEQYIIDIIGEKLGNKLFTNIQGSKTIPLATFIKSFGIPLIGGSASDKIAAATNDFWSLNADICKAAGLGQKATSNLTNWLSEYYEEYKDLPIKTEVNEVSEVKETTCTVAITGKLKDFSSRGKAKSYLTPLGVNVTTSISSKTDYLVCDIESSNSSSYKKAIKLNIPIITMNNLLKDILKENN